MTATRGILSAPAHSCKSCAVCGDMRIFIFTLFGFSVFGRPVLGDTGSPPHFSPLQQLYIAYTKSQEGIYKIMLVCTSPLAPQQPRHATRSGFRPCGAPGIVPSRHDIPPPAGGVAASSRTGGSSTTTAHRSLLPCVHTPFFAVVRQMCATAFLLLILSAFLCAVYSLNHLFV